MKELPKVLDKTKRDIESQKKWEENTINKCPTCGNYHPHYFIDTEDSHCISCDFSNHFEPSTPKEISPKFKTGDWVFHTIVGWIKIEKADKDYCFIRDLLIEGNTYKETIYFQDGRYLETDITPRIYTVEDAAKRFPEFPKPKTMVKKGLIVYHFNGCISLTSKPYTKKNFERWKSKEVRFLQFLEIPGECCVEMVEE